METILEIKNHYAQEKGYEDWEVYFINHFASSSFSMTATLSVFEKCMDEICIRAQKAALEKAAENAKLVPLQGIGFIDFSKQMLDKHSITNPENLIR